MPYTKAVASEAHVGEVGARFAEVGDSFTRPANTTAYASGDLVANSTTAGSVAPLEFPVGRIEGGNGAVQSVTLRSNRTGLSAGSPPANASFRLHLYRASPTPANGDNDAWLTDQGDDYLASIDVSMDRAFNDGAAGTAVASPEIPFDLPAGETTIYGLLEARAAYTPASAEVLEVELRVRQN